MWDVVILFIGVPLVLALLVYFVFNFCKTGYFNTPEISVLENPPVLSKNLTIFYKFCLGSYSNVSNVINDVTNILPKENTLILGIFYDDPKSVEAERCQSAIGCLFKCDADFLFEENFALQLTRWGFEKMTLHKVDRAVYCKQQYSSFLSYLHLSKIRANFYHFLKELKIKTTCLVEVHKTTSDGKKIVELLAPLDNIEEFYVPEYMSKKKLDSFMSRKTFDSDVSESESDLCGEDDAELSSASQLEDEDEHSFIN